jgi:hypothetical protein
MNRRFLTGWCYVAALAVSVGLITVNVSGSTAVAQGQTQFDKSQQVKDFMANPSSLLTQNPDGGAKMVSQVANLVQSDPGALDALIALLTTANASQQSAIGAGLGQAALALAASNPELGNRIQTAIARSGVQTAIASYSGVTGNSLIGSLGTGGAGGGGGGPTGNGPPTGGTGGAGSSPTTTSGVGTTGFTFGNPTSSVVGTTTTTTVSQ